ncbi:hypothetical protein MTR62_12095 [Novosphingobium sp. 1949]|uniref:Uncharacterized protein n=1 Tax=Novosphingobium organovorum TaxID=2930092 RepID=A0ABT0BEF2_9SPHN|nr:hypothetical protein [Novosphingobium organovorum]MCJ2183424.1 hypothetical protein [Novosphingobium organovorum]
MDPALTKIARAHALLVEALALLDEREFLVEAAFVQTALDRVGETIGILPSEANAPSAQD